LAAASLLAALGAPTPAVVINEARSGGRSVDPIPLAPTPARVVSHTLSLTENGPRDAWQVLSRLVIENPTASPLSLRLALPEERPYAEADASGWAGRFQDLTAFVDGEELTVTQARLEGFHDEQLGDVAVMALLLPAMGRVTLQVAYLVDRSSGLDWWGPRHHARAPELWGGPTGELRLTVTLRRPVPYVIHPRSLQLTRFEERADPNGDGSLTELVLDARPWRPNSATARGQWHGRLREHRHTATGCYACVDDCTCQQRRTDDPKHSILTTSARTGHHRTPQRAREPAGSAHATRPVHVGTAR
jgi:hypothetical protein